jgi:hypothetical protein
MGVMIMGVTMLLFSLYWPMWGSMLTPGNDEYAEEDYYLKVGVRVMGVECDQGDCAPAPACSGTHNAAWA